jgi:hypothetical protein
LLLQGLRDLLLLLLLLLLPRRRLDAFGRGQRQPLLDRRFSCLGAGAPSGDPLLGARKKSGGVGALGLEAADGAAQQRGLALGSR